MKLQALAVASLLLLSSHAKPPGATTFGYEVVQASPSQFWDVVGVRDLHQTGMVVRVDPNCPPPNVVRITTRGGLSVLLPVTSYGPLGGGLWSISTEHRLVLAKPSPARLVARSTANDASYRGSLVTLR